MQKSVLTLLLVHALFSQAASAQQAKQKECFTKAEQTAEQLVRGGLRLREGALGCDRPPWNAQTKPLWDDINQRFGPQFANQTKIRAAAFQREFADDAENRLKVWDGRIVFHFRHYPLSETYCAGIKDMLEELKSKGWKTFANRATKASEEVRMDYKPCP